MSPLAEPALAPAAEALVPVERLEDGEVVLLAVKPSRCFVLLVSWPWMAVAAAVAAGAALADWGIGAPVNLRLVGLFCTAVACTRLTLACFQWQGRLYVLTNRRVMRFRGAFHEDFHQCPLKRIAEVHLTATLPERMGGVGTLWFERADADGRRPDCCWLHLPEPQEAQEAVEKALRRIR